MTMDLSRMSPESRIATRNRMHLRLGNPRPYVEANFKIVDVRNNLVPMKYLPLQEMYHGMVFPANYEMGQPRDVTWVKARKATVSAMAMAWDAAYFFGLGWNVAVIANSEDTLSPLSKMVETFYRNMPEHEKPPIFNQVWGTEKRQVVFRDEETKETRIATLVMSSSKSPNFLRGETLQIVHLDEYAFFDSNYNPSAMQNSLGAGAYVWRISTANGKDKNFYPNAMAAKKKENRSQVYIFKEWWENPENWYGEDDDNRRSEDVGELEPGMAGGLPDELVRDEPLIVGLFPKEKRAGGYLAFRRRKLADALRNKANDPRAAKSAFLQEYPEDDVSCFSNLINPIFDTFLLDAQVKEAEKEIGLTVGGVPPTSGGMSFWACRRPVPGHSYAGGLDYSAMKGRDASAMPIKDLNTGEYVAYIYGNSALTVPAITSYAVQVLTAYNYGMLIPEINHMGRTEGNFAYYDLGYKNVYRRRKRPAESVTSKTFINREYGWETTADSRKSMIVAGQAHYNEGKIKMRIAALGRDMQDWNPETPRPDVDATKKHFPDLLTGFFIIECVDPQPDKASLYGAAGGLKHPPPHLQGHGRRLAAPFTRMR